MQNLLNSILGTPTKPSGPNTVGAPVSPSMTNPFNQKPQGPYQPSSGIHPGGNPLARGGMAASAPRPTGLYQGANLTGGQEAANYGQNLAANGVTGMYQGLTTPGQEAANYATNLNSYHLYDQQGNQTASNPAIQNAWDHGLLSNHVQNFRPVSEFSGTRPDWGVGPRPPKPAAATTTPAPTPQTGTATESYNPLFSESDTAQRVAAEAAQFNNDPRYQMKQFTRPGRSNDIGTLSAAMPKMAEAGAGMLNAQQQIPFQDNMANQQFLLNQQTQQGQEGQGIQNLLNQITGMNNNQNNSQFNMMLQSLVGLI